MWGTLTEGDEVELVVGRTLGWVRSARIIRPSRFRAAQ
ncbi:hypothetical protein AS9A_3718 [Hoyosella subflava DQS3-9A1]|uniref:Uncharacterized protein n=1 Tax=Hoyosella subflava (strain DSM 45089 / JCM 17490 / NBRC 109087 / DQS3-9A1) TaxID=443218 RepID=F6EF19_HOYSD|nr:hypothetical protein AS9A_3718 [Hoyosella subflava DQS3-9A1]